MAKQTVQILDDYWKLQWQKRYQLMPTEENNPLPSLASKSDINLVFNWKDEKDRRMAKTKAENPINFFPVSFLGMQPVQCDFTFNQNETSQTIFNIDNQAEFLKENYSKDNNFIFNGCYKDVTLFQNFPWKSVTINYKNNVYTPTDNQHSWDRRKHRIVVYSKNIKNLSFNNSLEDFYVDNIESPSLQELKINNMKKVIWTAYSCSMPNIKKIDFSGVGFLSLTTTNLIDELNLDLRPDENFNQNSVQDIKEREKTVEAGVDAFIKKINPACDIILDPDMSIYWSSLPDRPGANKNDDDFEVPWKIKEIWPDKISSKDGKVHLTPVDLLEYRFIKQKEYMDSEMPKIESKFEKYVKKSKEGKLLEEEKHLERSR